MKKPLRASELETLLFERQVIQKGYTSIAGVDEAGRGPLAGPVVAAACVAPPGIVYDYVNDSKKLSRERRQALYQLLLDDPRVAFAVGVVDATTIDAINILQATIRAMQQAVDKLDPAPDYLLVDGLKLPHPLPSEKIIKGDERCHSIACASVIAKEHRDRLMEAYAKEYPQYGFDKHKGYGTERHLQALREHGPSPIHRRSFHSKRLTISD